MQLIKSTTLPLKQAVIYEVNLTIVNDVIEQFDAWLKKHIDEMLAIPGFISASTSVIENDDNDTKQRCVQYRLTDQAALDAYFENDAERMRAHGLKKFPNKISATRRVLTPSQAALAEDATCANCETQLEGRFCSSCGQREEPRVPTFMAMIREVTNALFGLESKLWISIHVLMFKPGQLTLEYLNGKRQRYTSPFRLYLLFSIIVFAYLAVIGGRAVDNADPIPSENIRMDLTKDDIVVFGGFVSPEVENELKDTIINLSESIKRDLQEGNLKKVLAKFLEPIPKALLIFLPFIAILFKLIYLGTGKYYIEHLIYLLHNHAFLFGVLFFSVFANQVAGNNSFVDFWLACAMLGLVSYFFFYERIKRYIKEFKQKWFRVIIKSILFISIFYGIFSLTFTNGLEVVIVLLWTILVPYYLYRSMRVVYKRGRTMTIVNYIMIFISYLIFTSLLLLATIIFTGLNYS